MAQIIHIDSPSEVSLSLESEVVSESLELESAMWWFDDSVIMDRNRVTPLRNELLIITSYKNVPSICRLCSTFSSFSVVRGCSRGLEAAEVT